MFSKVLKAWLTALILIPALAAAETNTVTSTVTGTTTVDKTPPSANAPSIVINNQDVCTSASSVAVQTQILGFATGQTVTDENCERLKLARSLYGMGMKVAAVSVLCQDERVFRGMQMAGTPCPYMGAIGPEATKLWEENPSGPQSPSPSSPAVTEKGSSDDKKPLAIFGGLLALLLIL